MTPISIGTIAIGPTGMPAPTWWRDDRAARDARFADLDRRIEEARREIERNSGPRPRPAATTSRAAAPATIDTAAIYRARNRPRAAEEAEPERSTLCEAECYASTTSDADLCDPTRGCWAKTVGARAALGRPRPRLAVERGRTVSARPRSLGDIARDVYHDTPAAATESGLIATSARGSRPHPRRTP